jgi:predicted AlkP superfamily phosphohydrolase/phosphomutase
MSDSTGKPSAVGGRALYTRREACGILAGAAVLAAGMPRPATAAAPGRSARRMIILAIDGMDPSLLAEYAARGITPNCASLMRNGGFSPLGTSDPPQSPVAWSNFLSGTNPGGHGIFDFIARDAKSLTPHLSTARTIPSRRRIRLGKYSLPVSASRVELLRKGHSLWTLLSEAGIGTVALRSPVDFPPTPTIGNTLSGLTTPDIHGSYGVFSFYSDSPATHTHEVAGGDIRRVEWNGNTAECALRGPADSTRTDGTTADIAFSIERGGEQALIRIQGHRVLMRTGEWSPWLAISFPVLPHLAGISGICRMYLRRIRPHLELYITPVNIDPENQAMPISAPERYARNLSRVISPFYTQGMPEDTAALSAGVFDDDDYRQQAGMVLDEQVLQSLHELDRFRSGVLYLYFSCLDLNSHAFWRCLDRDHPLYSEDLAKRHGDFLPSLYRRMDEVVGRALGILGDSGTLLTLSDHGFVSFRRQFNLNSWLMDNGYAAPLNPLDRGGTTFFQNTDWSRTRAYGLGINSLYLNVRGREPSGIVQPEAVEELSNEIAARLSAVRDPLNGQPVFARVYRPRDIYSGPCMDMAPDLILGYNRHYRASWDTILGAYPRSVVLDNKDPWSGDHCMDASFLRGVLLTNRQIKLEAPNLTDMAPSVLNLFGVPVPPEMTGRAVL